MLNKMFVILGFTFLSVSASYAQQKITITPAGTLNPAPTSRVSRDSLELIPGTLEAPADSKPMRPIPEVSAYRRASIKNIPIPTANPMGVEFCEIDIYPFEH